MKIVQCAYHASDFSAFEECVLHESHPVSSAFQHKLHSEFDRGHHFLRTSACVLWRFCDFALLVIELNEELECLMPRASGLTQRCDVVFHRFARFESRQAMVHAARRHLAEIRLDAVRVHEKLTRALACIANHAHVADVGIAQFALREFRGEEIMRVDPCFVRFENIGLQVHLDVEQRLESLDERNRVGDDRMRVALVASRIAMQQRDWKRHELNGYLVRDFVVCDFA
jgi:hypothetical protein